MAKFDFNNSRYAKFFSDKSNQRFLQSFLDKKDIFKTNYGWYLTQGRIATNFTPIDANGIATFSVKARKLEAAKLMNMRAPLGETTQGDKAGFEWYSDSIPDFISEGFKENALERDYRMRQYEEFGNDADLVAEWADNVQSKIDSLDTTMNFLTANLMAKGEMDYTGIAKGIQMPISKAIIPAENFKKAGAKKWTDPDCNILNVMKQMEYQYRDERGGYSGALGWQFTRNCYHNTFLNNASIKELWQNWCKANYKAYIAGMDVNSVEFNKAFADINGVSPIEIVTEQERNATWTTDTRIQSWPDNVVVLRPAGKVVEFQRKEIIDRRMITNLGNNLIKTVFATTNNGLGLLVNEESASGRFKEWSTKLMLASVPSLTDFPDHVIIDTNDTE